MVIAVFTHDRIYTNASGLWQWDYGQILRIQGLKLPKAVEIHFSKTEVSGDSVTRIGITQDGVTDVLIPDSMLETDGDIYAFVYLRTEDEGQTEYMVRMRVNARPKPEVTGTSEEGEIFEEILATINGAVDFIAKSEKNALQYADDAKKAAQDAEGAKDKTSEMAAEVQQAAEGIVQDREQIQKNKEDAAKLMNTDDNPAPAGKVWTATKNGAGWENQQGGGETCDKYDIVLTQNAQAINVFDGKNYKFLRFRMFHAATKESTFALTINGSDRFATMLKSYDYTAASEANVTVSDTKIGSNPQKIIYVGTNSSSNSQQMKIENAKGPTINDLTISLTDSESEFLAGTEVHVEAFE